MAEENQTPETETPEVDYVEVIKQMKQNTVSKEQYDKLKGENAKLLQSILNGEEAPAVEPTKPEAEQIKDLRNSLYSGDGFHGSDIEFWTKTLDLRDKVIAEEGYDPMVPKGRQAAPTAADYEAAERIATIVREKIDEADGDNSRFVSLLSKVTTPTRLDGLSTKK